MIQAASSNIGLVLLILPSGSMALTLIGSQRAEARGSWLLQRALLREVSGLAAGVTPTALAAVIGVESVAVTSRGIPACRVVAGVMAVWVVGPRGLRGEPLWGRRSPGCGQAAGPLTTRSTLTHHPSLMTLTSSLVLVLDHYGSIYHGLQVRIVHGYKIGL
jgi:hypothetical protein